MREFKSGLSRYVARARAGEIIEITSHDRPVARLVGIPELAEFAALRTLFSAGDATWSGRKPALPPKVRLTATAGSTIADTVLSDRG